MKFTELDIKELTLAQRTQLSISLLKAIDKIHKQGQIHLNLDPNHIEINQETLEITLMGDTIHKDDYFDAEIENAIAFAAPETILYFRDYKKYKGQTIDEKADLFSAGMLIAKIWGWRNPSADLQKIRKIDPAPHHVDLVNKSILTKKYIENKDNKIILTHVNELINKLIDDTASARCTAEAALEQLSQPKKEELPPLKYKSTLSEDGAPKASTEQHADIMRKIKVILNDKQYWKKRTHSLVCNEPRTIELFRKAINQSASNDPTIIERLSKIADKSITDKEQHPNVYAFFRGQRDNDTTKFYEWIRDLSDNDPKKKEAAVSKIDTLYQEICPSKPLVKV